MYGLKIFFNWWKGEEIYPVTEKSNSYTILPLVNANTEQGL